jgi:hypothetical protein
VSVFGGGHDVGGRDRVGCCEGLAVDVGGVCDCASICGDYGCTEWVGGKV